MACGLATAVCALAFGAGTAAAAEFTASGPPFPLKLKGHALGPQELRFNKIRITCAKAGVKGAVPSSPLASLELEVSYKECTTGPVSIWGKKGEVAMHLKEKQLYSYSANGWVMANESIEMKAQYLKCFVEWDGGIYPPVAEERPEREYTAAKYSPNVVEIEPGVFREKLVISNEFKNIEWSEEGGGFCEDPEITLLEGETGKYTGQLEVEVVKGNIAFKG